MNNIIDLNQFRKNKNKQQYKKKKMLFLVIIIGLIVGLFAWKLLIEDYIEAENVNIPDSSNIAYSLSEASAITPGELANEIDRSDDRPILLYLYTTWCKICFKHLPDINEISKEFQNSDLKILAIAIDKDIDEAKFKNYLSQFGNIYFHPRYLAFRDGFKSMLEIRGIKYSRKIPYTVILSRNGSVITKFSGSKSKIYIRKKIIKSLFQ